MNSNIDETEERPAFKILMSLVKIRNILDKMEKELIEQVLAKKAKINNTNTILHYQHNNNMCIDCLTELNSGIE